MKKNIPQNKFYTKDGQRITIRNMTPDDTALLVDIFDHMSSESRYRRFHQTLDNVTENRVWQEATQITNHDPADSLGLIAFSDSFPEIGIPVAAARLVRTGSEEAEVAISVRDDYQNIGIGTKLMGLLADEAKNNGYRRLIAAIQNDNKAIWRVFKNLPYHVFRSPDGSYANIVIILTPIRVGDKNTAASVIS